MKILRFCVTLWVESDKSERISNSNAWGGEVFLILKFFSEKFMEIS